MRIYQVGSYYCESVKKSFNNSSYSSKPDFNFKLVPLQADTVSFRGKNYGKDSIKAPTGHCAYCGAKLYTDAELAVMAKDLMQFKGPKLQGKIRSITEKLGNKNSDNALISKKAEVNKENIEFFESFAEYSLKNDKLKGSELLKHFYQLEGQKSVDFLKKNLHPLLGTVDHVVAQKEGVDNSDSDLNLVESCSTCNHDIKNGMSFSSFYFTYPSIKEEMPKDKFEFATLGLLKDAPSLVVDRSSVDDLLKVIESLFGQEQAAKQSLHSVKTKIANCKNSILATIDKIESEKQEKRDEIDRLESQNIEHSKDEEYEVISKRVELTTVISDYKRQISELQQSHSRTSNSVQSWEKKIAESEKDSQGSHSAKKKSSTQKREISQEEMQKKLEESRAARADIKKQIDELTPVLEQKEGELAKLNEKHPDLDSLKNEKTRLESLISAHSQLESLQIKQQENKARRDEIKAQMEELKAEEERLLAQKSVIKVPTPEQIEKKKRYIDLEIALTQVESNTLSKEQKLIASFAKPQIMSEIESLSSEPLIREYLNEKRIAEVKGIRASLNSTLGTLRAQEDAITTQIVMQTTNIQANSKSTLISGSNEQDDSDISSYSLSRVKSQLVTTESRIKKLETELEKIPAERQPSIPTSDAAYSEYVSLSSRLSEIEAELCQKISKVRMNELLTESSDIKQKIEKLYQTDGAVYESKNAFEFERIQEQLEQLYKGIVSCSSGKEKAAHQRQINALEQQKQELYEKDTGIFNRINTKKRNEIQEDLNKARDNKAELLTQKAEIEKKLNDSSCISEGFCADNIQTQIEKLSIVIKRLADKTLWLEVPDRVKKIEAEIRILDQSIDSLRKKIASIDAESVEN